MTKKSFPRRPVTALIALLSWLLSASVCIVTAPPARAETLEAHINIQSDRIYLDIDGEGDGNQDRDRLRRARLAVKWSPEAMPAFSLKAEYDLASEAWADAFIKLDAGGGHWQFGQFKQPLGMETLTSDKDALFMESAVGSAFGIDRRLGIGYDHRFGNWQGFVSLYGRDLKNDDAGDGTAARLIWTPLGREARVLHLGMAAAQEHPDSHELRVRLRPEVSVGSLRLIDSGTLVDIDRIGRQSMELAWRSGPLLLQGEHLRLQGDSNSLSDLDAKATQLSMGWFITGESRPYKDGVFGSPTATRRGGALELALRWSDTTLQRDGLDQSQQSVGVGFNWYFHKQARLMLDGHRSRADGGSHDGERATAVQARIQLAF